MTETAVAPVVAKLGGNRSRVVPLEYPAELADGAIVSEITVRRMTAAEVEAFVAAAAAAQEARLPMFDQPPEVLDALDPDDFDELNKVATEMLPRRLRRALDAVVQDQPVEALATAEPPPAAVAP